jgi:hypothetical protein
MLVFQSLFKKANHTLSYNKGCVIWVIFSWRIPQKTFVKEEYAVIYLI